jgi:hypothetical protein
MTAATQVPEKVPASAVQIGDRISGKKSGDYVEVVTISDGPKARRFIDGDGSTISRPRLTTQLYRLADAPTNGDDAPAVDTTTQPRKAPAKRKPTRCTEQDQATAILAQNRAQPAARITGPNIARLRDVLADNHGGDVFAALGGMSAATLARLSTGTTKIGQVKDQAQRDAFRDLAGSCGRETFYGQKFAGMLWAISKEDDAS